MGWLYLVLAGICEPQLKRNYHLIRRFVCERDAHRMSAMGRKLTFVVNNLFFLFPRFQVQGFTPPGVTLIIPLLLR